MFVGFIAIIVVLLIIVAAMSTGSTSGSGGVDQTKATKVLSEYSGLVQSFDFYKTVTTNSDYAGITVANLVTNGIVASTDVTGGEIVSKGLTGVSYTVDNTSMGVDADSSVAAGDASETASNSQMVVKVIMDEAVVSTSGIAAVVSTLTSKLGSIAVKDLDTAAGHAGDTVVEIITK